MNAVGTALPAHLLPTIAALIAALVSVASGSSWGAMVLLFPTVQSCVMRHTHTLIFTTLILGTLILATVYWAYSSTRPAFSIHLPSSFLFVRLGIAVGAKGGGLEGRSNVLIKVNNLP